MNWVKTPSSVLSTDNWVSSSFYPFTSSQGEGIDLRLEMMHLLYGSASRLPKGHWIVYRRYLTNQPSEYYNKHTKEGVGGPTYKYQDTLLRTRRVPLAKGSDSLNALKAGMEISDSYIYYFTYDVNPKRGDHIMEIILDDHSSKPNINGISYSDERYLIKRIHPYRLENGNTQYWIVNCEYDEIRY